MKKIIFVSFIILGLIFSFSCTKKPTNPLGPIVPSISAWYIIDSANDSVSYVKPGDYSVSQNVLPNANSAVMADILINDKFAYFAGSYYNGEGSHDIRKIDLSSGYIVSLKDIGSGRIIPSGGIFFDNGNLYAISYSSSDGKVQIYDSALNLNQEISIGGMPQSIVAKNGNIYVANIDGYSYNTNWIDVVASGSSTSSRFILTHNGMTNKDPLSLTLNDVGDTLYVLCAGTWSGNNGYVAIITNIPNSPAFKTNISLGFNAYGKIKYHNGNIYFTGNNNLYKMSENALSPSPVSSVSGQSLDDIDFDNTYIYVTGGYGATTAFILRQSDDSLYKTINVNGGMGAIYR